MFQGRAHTCDFLTRTIFFIRNCMRFLARLNRIFRLPFTRAVLLTFLQGDEFAKI